MFILAQPWIEFPQPVRVGLRVLVFVVQHESLLVIETFLHKFRLSLDPRQIAWHLMHAIIAARYVVMAKRVVKLAVADEVDATSGRAELINVLPVCLLLQDVSVGVFEVDGVFAFFGNAAKESGVQIQNCLAAPIV